MGNYYEGNIRFILRKDLPEFIMDALLFIQDKDFKMPKKYSGIDIFNEENRNKVNIDFSAIIDNIDNTMFIDKDNYKYIINTYKNQIVGYELFVSVILNGKNNYNDLIDKWYSFFKDYIDISLSKECFTVKNDNILLGEVHDEDGTYDRYYLLNTPYIISNLQKYINYENDYEV